MGVNMFVSSSQEQASSTSSMVRQQIQGYQEVQKAINGFVIGTPFLKGKTYDSAKVYYHSVLIPLAKGGQLLSETVEKAVNKFPQEYQAKVDHGDLKQDELEERIRQANQLIQQTQYMRDQLSSSKMPDFSKAAQLTINGMMTNIYNDVKRELEEKLRKLLAFNASSPSIFSEIAALEAAVNQGLAQAKSAWNGSSGTFVVSNDLSWVKTIDSLIEAERATRILELNEIGEQEQINELMSSYNLDKEAATLIVKLQQNIIKKAKEEHWDNKDVIFEYNRLIASLVPESYVAKRWIAISGTLEKEDAIKRFKQFDLTNKEISYLYEKTYEQHISNVSNKDLAHEAVQLSAFTEKSWTSWPSISNAFHSTSHMMNFYLDTPATRSYEREEISFKGDVDSGRYDDTDFNSDLDPQNVYERQLKAKTEDIFKVGTQYNDGIAKNKINRVDEFYRNYGNGDSKKGEEKIRYIIEDVHSDGSHWISKSYTDEQKKKHQQDFFDYLKRGKEKNVQ